MFEEIIKNIVVETVKLTINEISLKKETTKRTLNTKEAAEYIGMSVNWVYQNLDVLPHRKIGRRLSFSIQDLDTFLNERRVKSENMSKLSFSEKVKKTEKGKYKVV